MKGFANIKNSPFHGVQLYELTEWRFFEDKSKDNFKDVMSKITDKNTNYLFLNNNVLEITGNITVETLIKNINSIGTMHVLDTNNNIVSKTSIVVSDMKLVLESGKNKYTFKIKVK